MVKKNTCIFISGNGSNLKNLILSSRSSNFPIKISLIICNNTNANGIIYAKKYNIPYIFINTKFYKIYCKDFLTLSIYYNSNYCFVIISETFVHHRVPTPDGIISLSSSNQ